VIYVEISLWLTHQKLDWPENFWSNFRNWGGNCPHCPPGYAPDLPHVPTQSTSPSPNLCCKLILQILMHHLQQAKYRISAQLQDCQPVFTKKSQTLSQKNPKSQIAVLRHIHKTCITKHKIDIKTCQKHRYDTIPFFRSIFYPRNYTIHRMFLGQQ